MLLGAVCSPTDAAAVFSVLRVVPLPGDERPLRPGADLLHDPRVAVRVDDSEHRPAVPVVEHGHLLALDTASHELGTGGVGVGDDELEPVEAARGHPAHRREGPHDDAAARARRRQLDDPAGRGVGVVVEGEPQPVAVELDRRVDVRDGDDDHLQGPVHDALTLPGQGHPAARASRRS